MSGQQLKRMLVRNLTVTGRSDAASGTCAGLTVVTYEDSGEGMKVMSFEPYTEEAEAMLYTGLRYVYDPDTGIMSESKNFQNL